VHNQDDKEREELNLRGSNLKSNNQSIVGSLILAQAAVVDELGVQALSKPRLLRWTSLLPKI